jgi:hypothetical protein
MFDAPAKIVLETTLPRKLRFRNLIREFFGGQMGRDDDSAIQNAAYRHRKSDDLQSKVKVQTFIARHEENEAEIPIAFTDCGNFHFFPAPSSFVINYTLRYHS